jgi:DNA-binding HxlR family transcriptional regulator
MISGGVGMDIVNDIPLSTVLNVSSPLQSGVDSLMIILAYGEEGTHYQLLDTNNDGTYDDWEWLTDEDGKPYTERTIGDLMSGDADSLFNSLTIETLMNVHAGSDDLMRALAYGNEGTHYVLVDGNPNDGITKKDVVQMLPKRYYLTGTKVYDEEHILIGSVDGETQSGIHTVHVIGDENAEYILPNPDGGYDVFPSLEAAQGYSADNDQRIYHGKTKLLDLRGEMAQICIERIELAAALNVDIFGTGENAPDPLMVQLAYGVEGKHYTLDRANKKIIWHKDENPNSETYGLYFHARTIHDMKDTHSLLESIYLDTVLGLTYQSPAIMLSLAYGNNYVINGTTIDYTNSTRNTIGDLMGNNATALIEGIEMRKIITNVKNGDAMMNYILYNMTHPDESHPDYKVRTLGDFMNGSSAIIEGMMNTLTLKEALGEDATSSGILHGLRDTKLNQLGSEIEKLTLKEVLGDSISTHPILKNMQNSTLATIDDDLSSLTIQQMMDDGTSEGIYHYITIGNENFRAVEVMVDGNPVWKEVLSTDANGYRTWTFADGSGQAPSPLKGAWKYLLIDSTGKERLYTLEKMNSAMGNISTNMVKATLNDLNADGLITISSNDGTNVLTEKIIYSLNLMGTTHEVCSPYLNADGTQKQTLGELTVSETIEYISKMLAVVKPFS